MCLNKSIKELNAEYQIPLFTKHSDGEVKRKFPNLGIYSWLNCKVIHLSKALYRGWYSFLKSEFETHFLAFKALCTVSSAVLALSAIFFEPCLLTNPCDMTCTALKGRAWAGG